MGALGGKSSGFVERIIDYMAPEDMEPEDRGALGKGKAAPKRSHKESADLATRLAMNPALSMSLLIGQPGFSKGMSDPLPDNSVPDFAKGAQGALAAKPGDWRDRVANRIDAEPREGEAFAKMLTTPFSGALRDPVKTASELSGYAPLSRARDAFAEAETPDLAYNAGRLVRGAGEGVLGAATVAGNAYGAGALGAKAFNGLRAPPLPVEAVHPTIARTKAWAAENMPEMSDDWQGMRGQFDEALAGAQDVNPELARAYFQDHVEAFRGLGTMDPGRQASKAGIRAAEIEAQRNPNVWDGLDTESPLTPTPRAAPQRQAMRGGDPDAYTPFDLTPDEQAAIDLSREYQGRTGMFDGPTLAPAPKGALGAMSPEQKAAMNAELERLAWAADDADKAGDAGMVAQAHEDIASILARTGKPLETSPRLTAIQDRIDAIKKELLTEAGAWKEEELLAEADDLMLERRTLRGKAPRGDSPSVLGSNGGNLFDDDGPPLVESVANWARGLGKKSTAANDQSLGFRLGKSEPWEAKPPIYRNSGKQAVQPANEGPPAPDAGLVPGSREDIATWAPDMRGYKNAFDAQRRRGALQPIEGGKVDEPPGYGDWAPEWRAAYDKGLDMSEEARMARAEEQGFSPLDYPLYHGTGSDFDAFRPSAAGADGPGVYLTMSPSKASAYAEDAVGNAGPNVVPVVIKAGADRPGRNGNFVVDDPVNIRATSAAFDPDNIGKPTILGSNGGNAFEGRRLTADSVSAAERTKVLQQFNNGEISRADAMERAGYNSPGAFYRAAGKVKTTGSIRDRGQWESREKQGQRQTRAAVSKTPFRIFADSEPEARLPEVPIKAPKAAAFRVDKDAVANEARAIMDEYGYIPRDYVTQIAGRLGINRNSVGRAIFNMKMAKDARVKGLPDWNDESNLMASSSRTSAKDIAKGAGAASLAIGLPYLQYRTASGVLGEMSDGEETPAPWMIEEQPARRGALGR